MRMEYNLIWHDGMKTVSMEALKLEPQIFLKLSSFLELFIANSFVIFIKSRETNISSFNAFLISFQKL